MPTDAPEPTEQACTGRAPAERKLCEATLDEIIHELSVNWDSGAVVVARRRDAERGERRFRSWGSPFEVSGLINYADEAARMTFREWMRPDEGDE